MFYESAIYNYIEKCEVLARQEKELIAIKKIAPPSVTVSHRRRREKTMKKENALMKLGRAVSEYLKGTPVPERAKGRNQPAHNHNHKQSKLSHSRHEQYREEQKAQNLNVARSQIANPDGTIITIDVFSRQSAHAKRNYRKNERK